MINFSKDTKLNCPEPVLVIVGGNTGSMLEIKAYVYNKNTKKIMMEQIANVYKK